MIDSSPIVQAGILEIPGQAWSVGGHFHWMEEPFLLCPDDENRMLDLIYTLFYDLSGRVGWSLALAASFLLVFC